ncbi:AI-2E family transporter, partial [Streptomyces lydicus]
MSRLPQWVGGLGAGLTRLSQRLEEQRRRAEAAVEVSPGGSLPGSLGEAGDPEELRRAEHADGHPAGGVKRPEGAVVHGVVGTVAEPRAPQRTDTATQPATEAAGAPDADAARTPESVPAPPSYAPAVAARPDPVDAVPWGMRVAAEAGWRLLVLAATLWVLARVITTIQLVVLSFIAAMLITALLQPTVGWLRRRGLPRGPATALTFIGGFVIMGLVGWFVVWQVQDNIDSVSSRIQEGISELKGWLLKSPFHVTESQINSIAKNLQDAIGANTEAITSAGLEGVTVVLEVFTGILLAMFTTLFLLYDGRRIWEWLLRLVPGAAREGVAGAGPRA